MTIADIRKEHLLPALALRYYIAVIIKLIITASKQDDSFSDVYFQNLRSGIVGSTRYLMSLTKTSTTPTGSSGNDFMICIFS